MRELHLTLVLLWLMGTGTQCTCNNGYLGRWMDTLCKLTLVEFNLPTSIRYPCVLRTSKAYGVLHLAFPTSSNVLNRSRTSTGAK